MKALTITLFFLTFGCNFLSAQEEIVSKIRKIYIDYNKQIESYAAEGLDFLPAKFEIKTTENRPALGPVEIKFTYFFDKISKEGTGENEYEQSTDGFLRKVVYTESMPSFTDYREFFYDEKGSLLFYYSKLTGYTCGEKRFYFDKGKLIKVKFNPIESKDCEDKLADFTRSSGKFTKDDLDWEKWIIIVAGHHTNAFQNMFQLME